MAKLPTATSSEADRPETLPEVEDDFQDEAAAAPARASADDEAGVDDAPAPKRERPEDPREAAVRKFREMRAREQGDANDDGADDGADDAADAADDEPAAAPAARAAAPVPVEQQAPDEPTYTLIVDGKPVTMKASEVVAKAQITVAADNRLEEAKNLLKEARALRGRSTDPEHQPGDEDDLNAQDDRAPDDDARAHQPKRKVDPAKLKEIVQRLQVGDEDEGQQALADFIDLVGADNATNVSADAVGRVVEEQMARAQVRGEIQQATATFREKFPAIVQDQEMLGTSLIRLNAELRQDLAQSGMPSEKLANLNGDQLIELHQSVRLKGGRVRPYQALLEKVGGDMVAKFGPILQSSTPQPRQSSQPSAAANANRIQERIDRKRTATPQPRTAGVRAASEQPSKPKTKPEIVAQMRRERGFR